MTKFFIYAIAFLPCTLGFVPGLTSRSGSFRFTTPRSAPKMELENLSDSSLVTRGELLKRLSVAAVGVVGAASCLPSHPALASDALDSTKRSYFRYVPRILDGMAWYQGDFQKAVTSENWPKVLEYFEEVNTASSYSQKPAMYQSSSSRFERDLFSPLSVWAQSFGLKGTGPKLKALMEQEEILEASMKDLEQAAMGKGLENTETQGQVANAAWTAGRDALQEYIDVANTGMPRQLNKVDTPFAKKS